MRIADYYFGQRIVLKSPHSVSEVTERINRATPYWFSIFSNGVKGGIWFTRLRLSHTRDWKFDYNAKPVLAGRVVSTFYGTELKACYRGPTFARLFFIFWYVVLTFVAGVLLIDWLDNALEPGGWLGLPVLVALLIFPVFLHKLGTRRSDEDLKAILAFLDDAAQFTVERQL